MPNRPFQTLDDQMVQHGPIPTPAEHVRHVEAGMYKRFDRLDAHLTAVVNARTWLNRLAKFPQLQGGVQSLVAKVTTTLWSEQVALEHNLLQESLKLPSPRSSRGNWLPEQELVHCVRKAIALIGDVDHAHGRDCDCPLCDDLAGIRWSFETALSFVESELRPVADDDEGDPGTANSLRLVTAHDEEAVDIPHVVSG